MSIVVRIAPLVFLAACATEPDAPEGARLTASANGREEVIVCGMEEPTGSRMRVKRCWTKEQLDQEGRDAQEFIKRGQLVRPAPTDPRGR
jgi:hypothetical protein